MAFESDNDRLALLRACGEQVTVSSSGAVIYGILNREYVETAKIEGYALVLSCRSLDVGALSHGAQLVVDGTTYSIYETKPDGTGMTDLVLKEIV